MRKDRNRFFVLAVPLYGPKHFQGFRTGEFVNNSYSLYIDHGDLYTDLAAINKKVNILNEKDRK